MSKTVKKKILLIGVCSLAVVLIMGSLYLQNNSPLPVIKLNDSINNFMAYTAVIKSRNGTNYLLYEADCDNLRRWIKSCPIEKQLQEDISQNWTYMLVFSDARNTAVWLDDTVYLPADSRNHYVYINEASEIIQFNDLSYLIYSSDKQGFINKEEFINGLLTYLQYDSDIQTLQ